MLWSPEKQYTEAPFRSEKDLEEAILKVQEALFSSSRIYLDVKKRIGQTGKGKIKNVPDGYLIDLSSKLEPRLYVVENELARHEPLKHIAVQILEFSLSFESSPHTVKKIIKQTLKEKRSAYRQCEQYAAENGFENVDYLLERLIIGKNRFNALVIIDEMREDLENVLIRKFQFPVEIITLQRYRSNQGDYLYQLEPFLSDVVVSKPREAAGKGRRTSLIDPAEIDTIVVPARPEGFKEVFLGENCWWAIRIHSSMIPKIRYIAAYQVAPVSAITYLAPVRSIEPYQDTGKYIVHFAEPAHKIKTIKLDKRGLAPQSARYTSLEKIRNAKNLSDIF